MMIEFTETDCNDTPLNLSTGNMNAQVRITKKLKVTWREKVLHKKYLLSLDSEEINKEM